MRGTGADVGGERGQPVDWQDLVVLLLLLLAVFTMQALTGALTSELTNADEPAHFISALLVRDYLRGGLGTAPLEYAREYYAHYPKIAIGNWPPLFHAVAGAWMLIFPARPASVLVLIGLLTVLLGWLVFRVLRPRVGAAHAAFGAGMLVALRPVPVYAGMLMLENALALATLIALVLWARYLQRGTVGAALAFGAAAVVALLTKSNALFLALVPPLSILIGRRWAVLRSRGTWLALLVVVLLAGPWIWYFLGPVISGWESAVPSLEYVRAALARFARWLWGTLGVVGSALLAAGVWARVVRAERAADDAIWVSAAALIPAVVLFHALVPAGVHVRHLIPAYPALAMFVAAGARVASDILRARGWGARRATGAVLGGAALVFAVEAFDVRRVRVEGYRTAALTVLERTGAQPGASLIVSGAAGEGAFIVEIAVRHERRPQHVVWRGTTLLSLATWAGREYRLRVDDDDLVGLLEQADVRYVVLDRTTPASPHQQQLDGVVAARTDRFALIAEIPLRRGSRRFERGLAVYELLPAAGFVPLAPRLRQVPGYDGVRAAGAT